MWARTGVSGRMCSIRTTARWKPSWRPPRCSPRVAAAKFISTTNPDIATGDGVAMVYRASTSGKSGVRAVSSHLSVSSQSQIIPRERSGAWRGRVLMSLDGREFMNDYHPLKSLAPRDIVARAIDSEMKKSGADHVLLDITHKSARFVIERFSQYLQDMSELRH